MRPTTTTSLRIAIRVTLCLVMTVAASTAFGQPRPGYSPSSTHVFPAGGKRGTTVKLFIGAECIPPETRFTLFGGGVVAPKLLTRRVIAPHEASPRRKPTTEPITIPREWESAITIDQSAPLGVVHWRLSCAQGGTALRPFVIGDLPEFLETTTNSTPQTADEVTLPVTINGRIYGERDNDYFRFSAKAGEVVVCDVLARRLQSRLDPIVEILDAAGRPIAVETAYAENDPVLAFRANSNGEYLLRIANVSHSGDAAHVYRINLSTRPFVRTVFPTSGTAGGERVVEFRLMTGTRAQRIVKRKVRFPATSADSTNPVQSFAYRLKHDGVEAANTVGFAIQHHNSEVAGRNHGQPETAQPLTLPVTVDGRFEDARDQDWFTIQTEKGTRYSIDCIVPRFGSVAWPTLQLRDAAGKQLAFLRSAESDDRRCRIDWQAPQTGLVRIRVRDQQYGVIGGPEFLYRLAVAKSAPDFALEIPAGSLNVIQGTETVVPITVRRFGGFDEPISLTVEGLPKGVTAKTELLSGKQKRFDLTLKVGKKAASQDATIHIVGRGRAGLTKLAHAAMPVRRSPGVTGRLEETVQLTVQHRPLFRLHCPEAYLYAHRGSVFQYPMTVERLDGFTGDVTIQVGDRQNRDMDGIEIGTITVSPMQSDISVPIYLPETMHINVQSQSQLYSQAYAQFTDAYGKRQSVLVLSEKRNMLRTLPPVVKLKTDDTPRTVKPGSRIAVKLELDRTTNFPGPMTVQLQPDSKRLGFLSEPLLIKAGQTKAVVMLTVPQTLPFSARITFRATGRMTDGTQIITEATVHVGAMASRTK